MTPRRARALPMRVGAVVSAAALLACGPTYPRKTVAVPQPEFADTASRQLDAPYPLDLDVGDVLAVQFPFRKDLDQEVIVRNDGRISLFFVPDQEAVGRSVDSVTQEVRAAYTAIAYDPSHPQEREYLLVPGDVLEVKFRSASQLNDSVQVRPDGRIALPLVKTLMAEGKTPEALQAELIDRYRPFLKDPDLVVMVRRSTSTRTYAGGKAILPAPRDVDDALVSIKTYAPRDVYVAGEVRTAGFVPYRPQLSVFQSIIGAGGTRPFASLSKVLVLRKTGVPHPLAIFLDLESDTKGESTNDFPLRPYDIVIVPMSGIGQVDQFLDQYLYQLIPATKNVNFTFFYNLKGTPAVP